MCWLCKPSLDEMSSALFYCWALPNVFRNSDVSGQKAFFLQQWVALEDLLGDMKKQWCEKIDLWMTKGSCDKLRVLCCAVIGSSMWSGQSGDLTAFPEGGSFWYCFLRYREASNSLPGPFPDHPLPLPAPLLISPLLYLQFQGTSYRCWYCMHYNSLFTCWPLRIVGRDQCGVMSY